jgi:hypothetical protein
MDKDSNTEAWIGPPDRNSEAIPLGHAALCPKLGHLILRGVKKGPFDQRHTAPDTETEKKQRGAGVG